MPALEKHKINGKTGCKKMNCTTVWKGQKKQEQTYSYASIDEVSASWCSQDAEFLGYSGHKAGLTLA